MIRSKKLLTGSLVALTVGSLLGLTEVLLRLATERVPSPYSAVVLVFYAAIAYGGCAFFLSLVVETLRPADVARPGARPAATALAFYVTVFALTASVDVGRILFLLSCFSVGALTYALARRLLRHVALPPRLWIGTHAVILGALPLLIALEFGRTALVVVFIALLLSTGVLAVLACNAATMPARRFGLAAAHFLPVAALVVTALELPWLAAKQGEPPRKRPAGNVLLITVDTLRADHLGCYGRASAKTPHIDGLARDGVVFEEAFAPAPRTAPSHATILTGLHPLRHGLVRNGQPLSEAVVTLPELLASGGYVTAGIVSAAPLENRTVQLSHRFGHWDENFSNWPGLRKSVLGLRIFSPLRDHGEWIGLHLRRFARPSGALERRASHTTDVALDWLDGVDDRPFFLWIHYFDPHFPYDPPRRFMPAGRSPTPLLRRWNAAEAEAERRQLLRDTAFVQGMVSAYDGEISYVDSQIGRLLTSLEILGIADDTLVILTADHGEAFGEHEIWFGHGDLFETTLHVPLIFRFPAGKAARGIRLRGLAHLADLAPTILEHLGLASPGGLDGQSLLPRILDGSAPPEEKAIGFHVEPEGWMMSLRSNGYKLLTTSEWRDGANVAPPVERLFDLRSDPGERTDITRLEPAVANGLRDALEPWRRSIPSTEISRDAEIRDHLRALGYLR